MPNLGLNGTASFLPDPPLCIALGSNFFQKTSFLLDSRADFLTCLVLSTRPGSIKQIHFTKRLLFCSLQDLLGTQAKHYLWSTAWPQNLAHIICQSSKLQSVKPFYFDLDKVSLPRGNNLEVSIPSPLQIHFFRNCLPPGSSRHAQIFFLNLSLLCLLTRLQDTHKLSKNLKIRPTIVTTALSIRKV